MFLLYVGEGENPEVDAQRRVKEERKRLRLEKEAEELNRDIER